MKASFSIIAVLALSLPAVAQQDHQGHHGSQGAATSNSPSSADFVQGEVRKVDREAGKVTLKHGPIPSLDMPGMTMVFRAKDPAMLEKLKVGDAVRFKADKVDGNITVTELKPAS